jgi:hypothetical protein
MRYVQVTYEHPGNDRCPFDHARWEVNVFEVQNGLVEYPAYLCIGCGCEPRMVGWKMKVTAESPEGRSLATDRTLRVKEGQDAKP